MATVKTQGSELFFVDLLTSSVAEVVKLNCPTGITGLGGAADQIDTTCLDATERGFVRGLGNPGQITVPFNLDPGAVSHQILFDLQESGENLDWLIGLSDGTGQPSLDSNDGLQHVSGRTSIIFNGYVADVNLDIATNEIVRGTLLIQRSGPLDIQWKS